MHIHTRSQLRAEVVPAARGVSVSSVRDDDVLSGLEETFRNDPVSRNAKPFRELVHEFRGVVYMGTAKQFADAFARFQRTKLNRLSHQGASSATKAAFAQQEAERLAIEHGWVPEEQVASTATA